MNFFKEVIANLLKNAFEGHTKFSVADNTAVGANPIRSITLDAVPVNNDTLISLSWEGGEKLFEKTLSEQEASHQFDLISTDLAEVAALTKQGEYDAAKGVMKSLTQKYAENTGEIVETNLPTLNHTQASKKVASALPESVKQEVVNMKPGMNDSGDTFYAFSHDGNQVYRGMWLPSFLADDFHQFQWMYDTETGEFKENPNYKATAYASQDDKLWRTAKITMQNLWFSNTDELLEYQQKQKGATSTQDHIPLWDAQKGKTPVKDQMSPASLSYEDAEKQKEKQHEDMQDHIDEKIKTELESALQQKAASVFGPDQVELVQVLRKNGRNWDEIKKILVKDFGFDKDSTNIFVDEQRQGSDPTGIEVEPIKEDKKEDKPLTPPEDLVSPETHDKLLQDHEDKKKDIKPVEAPKETNFTPKDVMDIPEDEIQDESSLDNEIARADNDDIHKVARNEDYHTCPNCKEEWPCNEEGCEAPKKLKCNNCTNKKTAADDLNPLQEPIQEAPTTPNQDVVPMGKSKDHDAPQNGDRVFVSSDLSGEKAGFEGTFISSYQSKGTEFSIVETDQGDLLDIESHRVTKTSEGTSGAQDVEPAMEPNIDMPKDDEIQVTPKMSDFHSLANDSFLQIKKEAEVLLQEIDGMGKTSYKFVKKGLEKHANDSAFEGNGWCRVWVTDDEVAADAKYAEALKIPDETARIEALKEIARNIAHEALRLADDSGAKVGVQSWFDSLSPSDHDRIDWVALANPVNEEEEDAKFEQGMADKYGPDAAIPPQAKSSLEPKVEKKAADGSACIKCHKTLSVDQMVGNEHGAGYLCKADAPAWNKEASADKEADSKTSSCSCGHTNIDHIFKGMTSPCADCDCKEFKKTASLKKEADTTWTEIGMPDPPEAGWRVQHKSGMTGTVVDGGDKFVNVTLDQPIKEDENTCGELGLSWIQLERGDHPKGVYAIYAETFGSWDGSAPSWLMTDASGQPVLPEGYKLPDHDINPNDEPAIDTESALKESAKGSACIKCKKVLPLDQMVGNEHGAGYLCKADAPAWNKEASDFEKGISQNKTADGKHKCPDCSFSTDDQGELSGHHFRMHNPVTKKADEPEVSPKTQFKDYKIAPKYAPKEQAVPATPEIDAVLSKMASLEQNLATLETARKQIQAKMQEEMAKVDQSGNRVEMEAQLQESIEKAGLLISAVESKVVQWKDKLYTLQTEEVSYVPKLTPKEMLSKIYAKFDGAEKYVQDVLNGMLAQAKNVMENTLIRWPNKKSELVTEADGNPVEMMNHFNDELLAALKELSTPL